MGWKYLDLLMAYGSPPATVGIMSPGNTSKINLKNLPKWKHEFEYFQTILNAFQLSSSSSSSSATASTVLRWKSQRSYFVTENVTFTPSESTDHNASSKVKMTVSACLRGVPLYAHSLMHICGVGVVRIVSITQGDSSSSSSSILEEDNPHIEVDHCALQDDLQMEAFGDDLAGEQTWPTEDEEALEMLPGGDEEGDIEMENDEEDTDHEGEEVEEGEDDFFNRETLTGRVKPPMNAHISRDPAATMGNNEAVEDGDDFVEVPGDVSARTRFARYRALQSFRSSFWHPHENLPSDYRRVFPLEDVKGMQRRYILF
jgi:pre-rRNA-processing protein TSR1